MAMRCLVPRLTAVRALTSTLLVLVALGVSPRAQQQAPLKQLQFDIVGVRLVVDPPALTVPKSIPTFINASLLTPPDPTIAATEAIAALTAGAVVEAELRGPSIPPTRIAVPVGSPIPIPPLALPGDYFLDGVRLVKDGQPVLDATAPDGRPATLIPIRVISEVFVTSVTSRPLTLDEIREKGIVIDQSSYQAVNFQAAFNIDGQPFTIELPAVLPTAELLQTTADRTAIIRQVTAINQTLAATQTTLPPEFDRPGINFSIAALPFFFVPEDESNIPALDVPPVNGLVVIAGNVAFLNQFFKVSVLVANVTPEGSQLQLRDVTGTVALPTGLDRIAGTPDAPGDDPLRLARVEGIGVLGSVPILETGPDGVLGTADDLPTIPPQTQGEGELLLEGLKEGGHTFDVNIEAFLDGLPSGPVRLVGLAAGAVFVRNPTFSVTLAHPRTIRSGETYDLYATVTNTSRSVANLVSVSLDPLSISGARLLSDPTVSFETIASGQSHTAKFTLQAQQTGEVTFSSFTGEAAAGGGIRLFTGIGERNVPLSPNAIVLPTTTTALPAPLVAAAQRVLGQAFSIATAPAEALPPDVLFVKRQTVIDRGLELGVAGERVQFGEPLDRVLHDLLLDWLGGSRFDAGFDQLIRTTDAGAGFLAAVGDIYAAAAAAGGALALQHALAESGAMRETAHVSLIGAGPAGTPLAALTITRTDGTVAAIGAPGSTTMPGGAALRVPNATRNVALAVVSQLQLQRHVFELTAAAAGAHDFGVVVPGAGPGVLRQLRYPGILLQPGGVARVEVDLSAPGTPSVSIDADGDGVFEGSSVPQALLVTEPAPQVIAVRQLESSSRAAPGDIRDPATYGLILGVLLNKPVTTASAQTKANYGLENNAVIGAALQPSGRVAYLYLQKPVGSLTPRSLRVSGLVDLRGQTLAPATTPIQMALDDGGHVFGQVREAGGAPVPDAVLRLTIVHGPDEAFDVATIRADHNGSFDFDFVARLGQHFVLTAQHPGTRDITSLAARLRGAGEQLLLNPTFTGRGTVRGRLLATDGTSLVPDVPVALIPGSELGSKGFTVRTNAAGEFVFTDVPVGVFTLSAADGRGGFVQNPGLLPSAGQTIVHDLVLVMQPEAAGYVEGRVFLADGATPGAGFTVYVGQYNRPSASIAAVDATTTDETGTFRFAAALPPNSYDVVAVDPATRQIGTTKASVLAGVTTSVSVVLEATGSVEGVVFNALGQPVPGAVIAGGLALGTADANGFFTITGVPAGPRTIQAGDPVTKRRGSASVVVVPGQTVRVAITLEARATITGRVLDANGQPMPRVSIRLPQQGGFTFVFTNNQGVYTFPDMPLGSYLIQAPGPSVDSLIDFMVNNGMDPRSAFTSGDAPPELGEQPPLSSSDANAVLAAYEEAVQRFFSVDESLLGLPIAQVGGFGFTKVQLFQDSTTVVADLKFLSQGYVGGRTEDSNGRPTGAIVRVLGLSVSVAGQPIVAELGRMNSDAATGQFLFGGIPRFDLETFQTAGVRSGDFTLDAAQPFSSAVLTLRGQLNTANPDLVDLVLRFPSATETNGTVSGQVVLPDGLTSAGSGTRVDISFGDLAVFTGPDGRFQSLLPIPAGTYTITATAANGLRGQAVARVPAGGNVDVQVRLLGLGGATLVVKRPNGLPVANALVRLERATFPQDRADGRTDANGTVHFVNLTEGPIGVVAEEEGTGLTGRASGAIVRDATVTVPLTITASGRITGTFLAADGVQTIPFAQVTISSGGVSAFTSTDSNGRFEVLSFPVGSFTVEANDPLTGRLGRASGALVFEGQTVDVTLLQLPRGTVAGLVLNADGASPVPAARVRLTSQSIVRTALQATARADGSFRFDGVPEGTFEVEATDPVSGFSGKGTGRITLEGELVDLVITLDPFGSMRVEVRSADGQPATNATVSLTGPAVRSAAVDATARFTFEHLPLGKYTVVARSLSNSGDAGQTVATIDTANQLVDTVVNLRGTGSVTVTVVEGDGVTRVPSARVVVTANGSFGDEPPGPASGTIEGFTDATGQVTFVNVPIGDFFARAEAAALAGLATGTVATPGATATVIVQLGASGAISGRVMLPDGVTPASQAIVTLRFQSQTQLQSGVLQVTTGISGTFSFSGVPLGTFTLSAFEIVSSGVQTATGSIVSNEQQVLLGDLVLDNAGPRVLSITPADGASGVAPSTAIAITFSEPIDPASVHASGGDANLVLLKGTTPIPVAAPSFSDGNRIVTLTPVAPLDSGAQYVVSLKGAPAGVKDTAALPMPDAFVSTFSVRDTIPPGVLSVSPANDALGVLPEALVRIAFSEPVATATLALRDAAGTLVPAVQAFSNANTVLVLSPQDFLQPNASYTVTVSNVTDFAGNLMPGSDIVTRFFTVDTLAPVITALQVSGVAREGSTVAVQPAIVATDTARVEFRTSNGLAIASTSAPFAINLTLPAAPSILLSAVAIDATGNRSAPFEQSIAIQANTAPVVTLTNMSGAADVSQGQVLSFQVRATDDADLSQVLFSAVGAATASSVQQVSAGVTDVTTTFSLTVPPTAPSRGTITVQAAALDASGLQSVPVSLVLSVRDGILPLVAIASPVNNAVVVSGQTIDVVVDTSDDVGLATVALVCNPVATGCEHRTIPPATAATRQTFTITIPDGMQAPQTLALSVVVTDTSGNTGTAGRVLRIADAIAPLITALDSVSGSTRIVAGTTVSVRAAVSDNVGVTALLFTTSGALTTSGTSVVSPPVASGSAALAFDVPETVANGSTIALSVRARDAAGNLSDAATLAFTVGDVVAPSIEFLAPADGARLDPGQPLTVRLRATDDTAVGRVLLTATGVISASEAIDVVPASTPAEVMFTLAVPTGTPAGTIALSAVAIDAAGTSSASVQRTVTVNDIVAPDVRISAPAAGTIVDPRTSVDVAVEAADAIGVTTVTLNATGVIVATQSRTIEPPATGRTEVFTMTFGELPARGGTLTLSASARDAAGNQGTSTSVALQVEDVVAPSVAAITPVNGATGVSETTTVAVQFSEPVDPSGIVAANVRLTAEATVVSAALALSASGELLTITPAAPLSLSTAYTVTIEGISDPAGNAMAAAFVSSFTTRAPDDDSPRVVTVVPQDGATGVPLTTPVTVTFTEPVLRASITAATFGVAVNGTAVQGAFTFSNGDATVRFLPAEPWAAGATVVTSLSNGITDTAGHALVDANGATLSEPLTFSFATAAFGITHPRTGSSVVENTTLLLEARGDAGLGLATVTFGVNGTELAPVTGPVFSTSFAVPAAASTPSLTIVATGRDSGGAVVATDTITVPVVTGLKADPRLTGIPLGGTATVRLRLSSPAPEDLQIVVSANEAGIVTLPQQPLLLAAGQTEASLSIGGAAAGATTVFAQSSLGTAAFIASVSELVPGASVSLAANATAATVKPVPAIATVFTAPAAESSLTVRLVSAPAAAPVPVDVVSSNPAVVSATALPIAAGSQVSQITLLTGEAGVAVLTLNVGGSLAALTVVVGPAPAGLASAVVAGAAGVTVQPVSPIATLFAAPAQIAGSSIRLLASPASAPVPVTVTSSNPSVASASADPIPSGSVMAALSITTNEAGVATLTITAGDSQAAVTLFVGAPPAGIGSAVSARITSANVQPAVPLAHVFATPATTPTLGLRLLSAPAAQPLAVQVSSSNSAVVHVQGDVVIAAGSQLASIPLQVGGAGTAVLTITAGAITRTLTVIAGPIPAGTGSGVVAQPTGVTIVPPVPLGGLGASSVGQYTFGIRLLSAPAASDTAVSISSSNPAVASIVDAVTVAAGQQVAPITIVSSQEGTATLTIIAAGQTRELSIFIGAAAAGRLPVSVARSPAVSVMSLVPTGAVLIMPVNRQATVGVPLLSSDASGQTNVSVTSSDESIARPLSISSIEAGSRTSTMTIESGQDGVALLTITVNGQARTLPVLVGTASAGRIPAVVAPIVAIEVK